jgi:hypothetical protein
MGAGNYILPKLKLVTHAIGIGETAHSKLVPFKLYPSP